MKTAGERSRTPARLTCANGGFTTKVLLSAYFMCRKTYVQICIDSKVRVGLHCDISEYYYSVN